MKIWRGFRRNLNTDLSVTMDMKRKWEKLITVVPEGDMNDVQSNSCWDIFLRTKNLSLKLELDE